MKRSSSFSFILVSLGLFIFFEVLLNSCSNNKSNPVTPDLSVPELTTHTVSAITTSTAHCGGTISSDGGAPITERGICWCTSQLPTISDNKTNDGNEVGNYTSEITGLSPGTTFYVRAYATNSVGTAYGSSVSFTTHDTLIDIDGNIYESVKIGNQWWMAENLKVTHYRNGDSIPKVTDKIEWSTIISGAFCNYANAASFDTTYGHLYNWFSVIDNRGIAPEGWHVPTDEEWKELEMYLGMSPNDADETEWRGTDEGGKLKEVGLTHWKSPNTGANNQSGFKALPGGGRAGYEPYEGNYYYLGELASIWSSTEATNLLAWFRDISYQKSNIKRSNISKRNGFSIRCVKD
jgi:uncharacterized protein (TIGR02145 family)